MKPCPSCGLSNKDEATECWKCGQQFLTITVQKRYRVGPAQANGLRRKALRFLILGLVMKFVWGGYMNWQIWDHPAFAAVRAWLVPLLIAGGLAVYLLGWVLRSV
jgi:thiosulfate reductase cytochrome b subunit